MGIMDLSSEELHRRTETLKEFDIFFENTTNTLNSFVEKIGWTLDETPTKDIVMVQCPFNSEHRMLPSKLEDHSQICKLKQNGYDSTHSFYPPHSCSTSSDQTMKIDEITQMQFLKSAYEESNFTLNIKHEPREISQSIERYVCDFTPDERRVLYDSVVKHTKPPNCDDDKSDLTGVDLFNKSGCDKPKSELDILQEQRDLKRRRVAYRGKRVHTDRKSYIEVLREVVEGLTNNLTHEENKSVCTITSNNISEAVSNNRTLYKYEGNQNYNGNPYTRWLDIEVEESNLLRYCERKSSCQEAGTSRFQLSNDKIERKRSKKSRSRSRERRRSSNEIKLKRSRLSRSRSKDRSKKYKKSKRSRTPLKSKDSKSRKCRSRSKSREFKQKKCKKHRTRSKSKDFVPRKKNKWSRSPEHVESTSSNEKNTTVKLKSSDYKKKKHKHKRTHSKSPKRSHKSKKKSSV